MNRFYPDIFPIQIRDDATVFVQGIPWNLTKAEAAKLARVVEAMAVEPKPLLRLPPPSAFAKEPAA